ncbi:organic hydroperoxide resistance protein [Aggregicoccus sp. 17bor-14]|uniref:organic hydroperoxide resistance protein n=1 Tax=Myxococcaceae TaxID=31 RepID=UPI00129CC3D9|nr:MULTISPECIES: organic hydroperoxide resistance protein [Myxococcaceae]MBF5041967.1 organic hydroperoxide resistance protein [Simulacricoccus sp. 17bor-14]MRI87748.1 organic hydroperoxide resistance protein [Aggregicoccus sp. 17bor-14]
MTPLYTATATSEGGRAGRVKSDEGTLDFQLAVPKGLGGPGGAGTNPEQLFAAGYSACFAGALGLVARTQGVNPGPHTITAKVSIGKDATSYGIAVELHGKFAELPREKAQALMEAAHQVCPYSKATRGNIDVKLLVD